MTEVRMATGDVQVTYRDAEDKWAVVVEGAAWAASLHEKKARAKRTGQKQAEENASELIVEDEDGKGHKRDTPRREP
jgi:hypothetical protein